MLKLEEFISARSSYTYVPARLVTSGTGADLEAHGLSLKMEVPHGWPANAATHSSIALDDYHSKLLMSDHDKEILTGLASVMFWGFASGVNGQVKAPRALGRAKQLFDASGVKVPDRPATQCDQVRHARDYLSERKISEALLEILKLKFFGLSFASKVIAFLRPDLAGVYDKVISDKLGRSSGELRDMHVSTTNAYGPAQLEKQALIFATWCKWCSERADELNVAGKQWTDWDGSRKAWRTVDVERALFAMKLDQPPA